MNELLPYITAEGAALIALKLTQFYSIDNAKDTLEGKVYLLSGNPFFLQPGEEAKPIPKPEHLNNSIIDEAIKYKEAIEEEVTTVLFKKYDKSAPVVDTVLTIYEEKLLIDSYSDSDLVPVWLANDPQFHFMLDTEATTVTKDSVAIWFLKKGETKIAELFNPHIMQKYPNGYEYSAKAAKKKKKDCSKAGEEGRTYSDEFLKKIEPIVKKLTPRVFTFEQARKEIEELTGQVAPVASTLSDWRSRIEYTGTILKS